MNQSNIHLLDLPNEILIIILNKLDNIDVLYSLFGINNKQLDILIEGNVCINILNFVRTSSITNSKLDRFCNHILPQKHHFIKKFILETTYMERILLVGDYPNLTSLELFNFGEEIAIRYFTDDSVFRHIFKHQITDLILHHNDQYPSRTLLDTYIKNVYSHIMILFQNLKHLTIIASFVNDYPPLSFLDLPSTSNFSSTLTELCIYVWFFDDCISLLDGRLPQLTTFIVQVNHIATTLFLSSFVGDLHNLKCFSLTSFNVTGHYDALVVSLLRCMTHLEKLSLYLRIRRRNPFVIDGIRLHNEILIHMFQLRTFYFYISTENYISELVHPLSIDDIQQAFTNTKYGKTACIIDYFDTYKTTIHVYSLPFTFTRLGTITNQFPDILFDTVTHLYASDVVPMEHEFFMRISRNFPLLKYFSLENRINQLWNDDQLKSDKNSSYSIIEYSHLMSLDIMHVNMDYIVQFLLETKTYLPRLTELKVNYKQLEIVTMNFTRDATRRNCSKVKRLIVESEIVFSKDVYQYFPLL